MVDGLPSLRSQVLLQHVRTAFEGGKQRFGMRLVHYSIQSNHVHCVVEASDRRSLTRGMRGLEIRIARAVNGELGRNGRLLADRYHARALKTPREVRNVLAYVLLNRRRHGGKIEIDWASSGALFDGWAIEVDLPDVFIATVARTRAPPETWLLRRGWRKHGLIRPTEIPGH
jgi:hypothetical protein